MKQKHYFIFEIILIVGILIFIAWRKFKKNPQRNTDTGGTPEEILPSQKVPNDKLIIVEDIGENDLKKILQEFCNLYNKDAYKAILRMTKLDEREFAITFPYDINFETFCFLINYLSYPMGFDRYFETTGWTTTKPTDAWITEKSGNKNAMLFISEFDTDYDNVFMTTSDNIGYKLGFAIGEEKHLLDKPAKNYTRQPISLNEVKVKEYIDFK